MPITEHTATIFVAIELSQRQWLAVVHSPERDRVSRYRLDGGDHNGLVAR